MSVQLVRIEEPNAPQAVLGLGQSGQAPPTIPAAQTARCTDSSKQTFLLSLSNPTSPTEQLFLFLFFMVFCANASPSVAFASLLSPRVPLHCFYPAPSQSTGWAPALPASLDLATFHWPWARFRARTSSLPALRPNHNQSLLGLVSCLSPAWIVLSWYGKQNDGGGGQGRGRLSHMLAPMTRYGLREEG